MCRLPARLPFITVIELDWPLETDWISYLMKSSFQSCLRGWFAPEHVVISEKEWHRFAQGTLELVSREFHRVLPRTWLLEYSLSRALARHLAKGCELAGMSLPFKKAPSRWESSQSTWNPAKEMKSFLALFVVSAVCVSMIQSAPYSRLVSSITNIF